MVTMGEIQCGGAHNKAKRIISFRTPVSNRGPLVTSPVQHS